MVLRFEMASRNGQRSILQYMVPWLSNIELVDECHPPPSGPVHPPPDYTLEEDEEDEGNMGLRGSGWGSLEGTKVVLHNLLYITAKVRVGAMMYYHLAENFHWTKISPSLATFVLQKYLILPMR